MFLMFCRAPRSGARHVGLAPSGARVRHRAEHKKLPFALRGRRYHEQRLNTGINYLVSFEVLGQQPHAPAGSRSHHACNARTAQKVLGWTIGSLWPEHAEEVQVVNFHIHACSGWQRMLGAPPTVASRIQGEDSAGALSISWVTSVWRSWVCWWESSIGIFEAFSKWIYMVQGYWTNRAQWRRYRWVLTPDSKGRSYSWTFSSLSLRLSFSALRSLSAVGSDWWNEFRILHEVSPSRLEQRNWQSRAEQSRISRLQFQRWVVFWEVDLSEWSVWSWIQVWLYVLNCQRAGGHEVEGGSVHLRSASGLKLGLKSWRTTRSFSSPSGCGDLLFGADWHPARRCREQSDAKGWWTRRRRKSVQSQMVGVCLTTSHLASTKMWHMFFLGLFYWLFLHVLSHIEYQGQIFKTQKVVCDPIV